MRQLLAGSFDEIADVVVVVAVDAERASAVVAGFAVAGGAATLDAAVAVAVGVVGAESTVVDK